MKWQAFVEAEMVSLGWIHDSLKLTPSLRLVDDLHLESMDILEIAVMLEEYGLETHGVGVEIKHEYLQEIVSVRTKGEAPTLGDLYEALSGSPWGQEMADAESR